MAQLERPPTAPDEVDPPRSVVTGHKPDGRKRDAQFGSPPIAGPRGRRPPRCIPGEIGRAAVVGNSRVRLRAEYVDGKEVAGLSVHERVKQHPHGVVIVQPRIALGQLRRGRLGIKRAKGDEEMRLILQHQHVRPGAGRATLRLVLDEVGDDGRTGPLRVCDDAIDRERCGGHARGQRDTRLRPARVGPGKHADHDGQEDTAHGPPAGPPIPQPVCAVPPWTCGGSSSRSYPSRAPTSRCRRCRARVHPSSL